MINIFLKSDSVCKFSNFLKFMFALKMNTFKGEHKTLFGEIR